ncbi:MAG TPA: cytochrome P460 family protein [Pyrinomonadaceae bacterium]|nr:cytochrome P460 family protein [Pyrinomonadaceae bacterium]
MKQIILVLVAVATLAGITTFKSRTSRSAVTQDATPIYGIKIPPEYRDWHMVSIANVGEPVNDLRVKLGNDLAIKAFREGTPFPDGAIIARLAYRAITSAENNKVFRAAAEKQGLAPDLITKLLAGSMVAGSPTNVQFMVKDSKKYPATGGWGFAQFTDGKPDGEAVHQTCFSCHSPAKDQDFVFTRYSP